MDNEQTHSDRVAARVRALRKSQDLTVAQLAELCAEAGMPQLTEQALYKLETRRAAPKSGTRRPVTVDELFVLARALGTTAGQLLLGEGSRNLGPMTPKGLRKLADDMEQSGIAWGDDADGRLRPVAREKPQARGEAVQLRHREEAAVSVVEAQER